MLPRWPERSGIVWLLVALFLLGLGMAKGIPPLILLSAFLIGAFITNLFLASRPLGDMNAQATEDSDLVAGEPGLVVFQVWSDHPATSDIQFHLEGSDDWVGLPGRLTTGQPCQLRLEAHPTRRGWLELPPLVASTSYPFGLVRAARNLCSKQKALVVPAAGLVQTGGLLKYLERRQARQELETRANRVRQSSTGEFHGLRPWRAGDSRRLIHWRTSARLGHLMVREHEAPGRQALLLMVDPGVTNRPLSRDERNNLERLVRMAAGIIRIWLRGSDRWLGVAVSGAEPGFFQAQGAAGEGERAMLRCLALCEPSTAGAKWPDVPPHLPGSLLTLRLHLGPPGEPPGRWANMTRRDLGGEQLADLPWFTDTDSAENCQVIA